MRRHYTALMFPLLCLAALNTGCATFQAMPPADKLSVVEQSFTTIVMGLNTAHAAGAFDAKAWTIITNATVKVNAALDVLGAAVASGAITTDKQLVNAAAWVTAQTAMSELFTFQQQAVEAPTNGRSTTRPASRRPRVQPVITNHYHAPNTGAPIYRRGTCGHYASAA